MLGKAAADLLDNVYDRRVVIVARDTDNDVRCLDLFDALGQVGPKGGIIFHGMDPFFD
jgi:hypothetical protein